uniref:Putative kazal protease inhibitor-like protein n=1 Tax=Rhipicephalus microplus TaxID=6941 RepID=A0A6G5A331_RHIMP
MATTKTLLPYLILFAILASNVNCRPRNSHANVTVRERSRSDYEYCLRQSCNVICPPPCACPSLFYQWLGYRGCTIGD